MHYLESILRVLLVGLLLGAGLPALFAVGLLAFSAGTDADGQSLRAANPLSRAVGVLLFAFVGAVIVLAILWITRATIVHHFGVDPFPFIHTK
jgi:preprotein translocase subunit SecG